MESTDRPTINQTLNGDDVVNLHSVRALAVDDQQFIAVDPLRGATLNVFSAEIKPSGIVGIGQPAKPSGLVDGLAPAVVGDFLECGDTLSVGGVSGVFVASPSVLVFDISADVFSDSGFVVSGSADLALVTNGVDLPVILGTRFIDTTDGADFGRFEFWAALHNSDIIARGGDVKQGELGGR